MDTQKMSEDSITVTEFGGKGGGGPKGPVLDDGTYEAEYQRMKIFMDNTQWGEKKCARLYFRVTRGKYKDQQTSFKGTFFQDNETKAWVVGSKSKLADAIRAVTGGKTLSAEHVGTKVFVVVKKKVSKTNNPYSFVESIIPRPAEEGEETLSQAAEATAKPAAAPAVATAPRPVQAAPKPAARPAVPAPTTDASESLLADLTELSDFKE